MIQLSATDADDPTYGNSARVVYSILEGQPYFSVDAKTGEIEKYFLDFFFNLDRKAETALPMERGDALGFLASIDVLDEQWIASANY